MRILVSVGVGPEIRQRFGRRVCDGAMIGRRKVIIVKIVSSLLK